MVFFTCSHCGESIKKPSVAKHYQTKCRSRVPFLTCVDCLKDFRDNEYESHTKCFTEVERYSAKGFVPKASSNKGERKQKAWSDCAQGLLTAGTLKSDERNFLQAIVKFDNIPRKKVKFLNFINTTARNFMSKPDLIDRVWEKLENYFKEANSENKNKPENGEEAMHSNKETKCEEKVEETGVEEEEGEKKKKKKRKKHSMNEEEKEEVQDKDDKKKKSKADETEETEPKSKKSKKCEGEVKPKANDKENVEEEVKSKDKKSKKAKKCEEEVKAKIDDKENVEEEVKSKDKKTKRAKECEEEVKAEADDKENVKEEVKGEGKKNKKSKINGMDDIEEPKSKKSKKCEEEVNTEMNGKENMEEEKKEEEHQNIFNWKDIVLSILSENGNGNQITLKKLQKKVLKKYCKYFECEVDDKIVKKFMKKLNKMKEVTVNDDCVSLSNC